MKLNLLLTTFLSLFFFASFNAQIVWTEPAFPTDQEPVTVFFDATQGTGGLAGCNCDVYIHAGLITSESNSNSDWKYVFTAWGQTNPDWQMTPVAGQPDVYSWDIEPSIRQRYNVTDPTETIEKLAFVFRNGNGSLEGKDVGGSDIFYDVQEDNSVFTAGFVTPGSNSVFTAVNETISVSVASNQPANLSLFEDGNLIASADNATSLNHDIVVSAVGDHLVELKANNGSEELTSSFTYVAVGSNNIAPLPAGLEPGINYRSDSEITFALVAPDKGNVFLIGDFNDWQLSADYQMNRTPDGLIWWTTVSDLTPGQTYAFQYLVDGEIRTGDPFSNLILDPSNDGWIEPAVFPNLHPYPTGKTTGIVSLCQPGAPEFDWQVDNFQRPDQTNLVIYEMLMRDFLVQDYESLTAMLDYFEELNITAIQLMPVNEFDANQSWGYNPTYHYALDKYYGSPEAFKTLVDACHERGIAVIVDIVFNHAHERNPLAMLYWNQADFRPAADNPWLNEEPTHAFNVFFDFNHESFFTREYFRKVLRHWLDEYRVDGFRFDLSKGFTQNANGPFDAGAYDAKRIETIKLYADEMWSTSPGSYVILEHFTANSEEEELSDYGCMLWGGFGPHDEYLEAAMGYSSNLSSVSYQNRGWDDPHLIAYMESHDEERMMYKNLQFGNSNGSYDVTDLSTALDRVELASTFFYTVPGPKMLWQFGELGYDYSINTCEDGVTIDPNCRLSPKPIPWDYTMEEDRIDVYNVVRQLLHLRNNYEAFTTTDFDLDVDQFWKTIHLNHPSMNVAILGNFDVVGQTFNPKFQQTGTWYEYFSGEMLNVNDVNANITLAPGEYRIYTDQQITLPDAVTSDDEVIRKAFDWLLAPNPSKGQAIINVDLVQAENVEWQIIDLQGKLLESSQLGLMSAGGHTITLPNLSAGMYLVRLQIGDSSEMKKLAVVD
ncbi:MAG: alpha-amylase family glycosyl hydrolase [Bacteroidota bacterium]